MSKTKLLFDLIMYVNNKRNFTAQEVAYEFNISVRTAHRYLLELSEMGVPLYTEPGRNGGYRILNNRMLSPVIFDEDEAFSIFFAFQSLKYYQSLPFDININSVSRKLYANLPNDSRRKVDQLGSVLSFWNNKRGISSPFLIEIIEAAMDNQILHIQYISKSENTIKKIVPIGVYAYNGFWYMPALDLHHNKIRLFRTDRILSLENTDEKLNPQITLIDWLDSHIKNVPKDPVRLYVKLTREGIRQCRSQPWLENHIILSDENHGYIDTIIDNSDLDFVSIYFYQLGTAAKVIEPSEVIDNVRKQSQDILLHYS
ncbi:YafY family transcriptional regulator [Clostridium swellfunianum]|uniref:helix-turn-helix transcriptional regulator n=1 Tax=Clostridium swellfunianum TaxID=1367462 RepID=UPI00202DC854|nr:YafY family protein [Clostridium swellfunianum]MCM0648063.1 YafY family transcriptional regulator [Clostridium swellfunianum]